MIIELAEKKIIHIVRDNLESFKLIEDESVKKAVIKIEEALKDYDSAIESIEESTKEEPLVEETSVVEEETVVKEVKEEIIAEEVEDTKVVEHAKVENKIIAADVQLSMEVATKLREAALELDSKEKALVDIKSAMELQLKVRDEIINGYKTKIMELSSNNKIVNDELDVYKKKEELELKRQKNQLTLDLIELYANLNITKTKGELEVFGLSQLVELRKALEVTLEKKNTPVRETVNSHSKTVKQPKTENSAKDTFEGLFGRNPDMY